jgi:hypothetical protein
MIGHHIVALSEKFQLQVKQLLMEFKHVLAWSYKKFKRILTSICEQKIELIVDAQPIKQHPYPMNPNYAQRIKEKLDKLLDTQFIFSIETTQWLSPLVIVPKKNGKL